MARPEFSLDDLAAISVEIDGVRHEAVRMPDRFGVGPAVYLALLDRPRGKGARRSTERPARFFSLKPRADGWADIEDVTGSITARLLHGRADRKAIADLVARLTVAGDRDALDWQEDHSPTVEIELRDISAEHGRARRLVVRRRLLDQRLWDGLSLDEQEAVQFIERGHRLLSAGLGYKPASWTRIDGGRAPVDSAIWSVADAVTKWRLHMARRRRNAEADATRDIICDGVPLRTIERRRRKKRGWARRALGVGLADFIAVNTGLFRTRPLTEGARSE